MKSYKRSLLDSKYNLKTSLEIRWEEDDISSSDTCIITIDGNEHWGSLQDTYKYTVLSTKYINLNTQEETSSANFIPDVNCARYRTYQVDFEFNMGWCEYHYTTKVSSIRRQLFKNPKTVKCSAVFSLIELPYKQGTLMTKVYGHVSEITDFNIVIDTENTFDGTLKYFYLDKREDNWLLVDLGNKSILLAYQNEELLEDFYNFDTSNTSVTSYLYTSANSNSNWVQFNYKSPGSSGLSFECDFKLYYTGEQYNTSNFDNLYNFTESINDLITNVELLYLDCSNAEKLYSTIKNDSGATLYVLSTDFSKCIPNENHDITFKIGKRGSVVFNHFDPEVKTILNWEWIHTVDNTTVTDKITVSYYKFSEVIGSRNPKKISAEIWYKLTYSERKSIKLYQVRLIDELVTPEDPGHVEELGKPSEEPESEGIKIDSEEESNQTTSEEPTLTASAGPKGQPGVEDDYVEPLQEEEDIFEAPRTIPGGRPEDVHAFVQRLQEETETYVAQVEEQRTRLEERKENKKLKRLLAKAAQIAAYAQQGLELFNLFKNNLLGGITNAATLAISSAEKILEQKQQQAIQNKINEFKSFTDEVVQRFQGLFRTYFTETVKPQLINILSNIREGDEVFLTAINTTHENCIVWVREQFELFIEEIENEANRIVEAINTEYFGKASAKLLYEVKTAIKNIQEKAENALIKANLFIQAQQEQLMLKLKALAGI